MPVWDLLATNHDQYYRKVIKTIYFDRKNNKIYNNLFVKNINIIQLYNYI
jgi:hypothetical protein